MRRRRAEFAVHLDQVRDGRATDDYQNPERFFERTYLTKSLGATAAEVVRRLSGERTETSAVFNMTTQFGGGKTHALTLLYHLATHGTESRDWPGVSQIRERAGVKEIPRAATAVFVGTEFDSIKGRGGDDGTPHRRTPWGEIAFQLAGREGFKAVAEHEAQRTAPAGEVIRALWVSHAYREGFRGAERDPLIGMGTAPLADPTFRSAVFEQLGESRLEGALTTDICGKPDSHAVRLDEEAVETLRKGQVHRKVATVIFFESNGGQTKSEATLPEVRLAVAGPDVEIGNVETGLEALSESCYYLTTEGTRYRFSLKENLNKRFADRRASVRGDDIERLILDQVEKIFPPAEGIERVFFPEQSAQVSLTRLVLSRLRQTGEIETEVSPRRRGCSSPRRPAALPEGVGLQETRKLRTRPYCCRRRRPSSWSSRPIWRPSWWFRQVRAWCLETLFPLSRNGHDQHGREIAVGEVRWTATGGEISADGQFDAGENEGNFVVTATVGERSGSAAVRIAKADEDDSGEVILSPARKLVWSGEIPAQKWTNFYMKVLTRLVSAGDVKLTVTVEARPRDGVTDQQVEETRAGLRGGSPSAVPPSDDPELLTALRHRRGRAAEPLGDHARPPTAPEPSSRRGVRRTDLPFFSFGARRTDLTPPFFPFCVRRTDLTPPFFSFGARRTDLTPPFFPFCVRRTDLMPPFFPFCVRRTDLTRRFFPFCVRRTDLTRRFFRSASAEWT